MNDEAERAACKMANHYGVSSVTALRIVAAYLATLPPPFEPTPTPSVRVDYDADGKVRSTYTAEWPPLRVFDGWSREYPINLGAPEARRTSVREFRPVYAARPCPVKLYDPKPRRFKALAQGKTDYTVEVDEVNGMMCVMATEEAVYITREQAVRFFSLTPDELRRESLNHRINEDRN